MTTVRIRTNNVPRPLLHWWDLTEKEKKEFDWIKEVDQDDAEFFRYRGWTYCVSDFTHTGEMPFQGKWDGYAGDTYFSGVLIRYTNNNEDVVCATYTS